MAKHEIRPHRTSGVQPHVSGAVRLPQALGDELIDLGALARVADRHDPLGSRRSALTEPTVRGDAVTVVIDGHRHGLPKGAELAPGRHVAYIRYRGTAYVLVPTPSGIRQLLLDRELADRVYQTHFQK